jgi:hypothetical protein
MYFSNLIRPEDYPKVVRSGPSSLAAADRLARTLGWFSIGLGFIEFLAPRSITRSLGIDGREALVRAYGAREIGAGVLALSVDKHAGLWSRVAGDGLDVLTLLGALRSNNPKRGNVGIALAMVLGVTALDLLAAQATGMRHQRRGPARRLYGERTGFPKGIEAVRAGAQAQAAASRPLRERSIP